MIAVGQPFPAFSLQDQTGQTVTNADLLGSPTIIYFYPKDDTPGCTKEACNFRDNLPHFSGAKVFGVSADSVASHQKFIEKYGLNFSLLADPNRELIEAAGVWVEKNMYGKKSMGIERSTFLVDAEGNVTKIWRKVKPDTHAEDVKKALG